MLEYIVEGKRNNCLLSLSISQSQQCVFCQSDSGKNSLICLYLATLTRTLCCFYKENIMNAASSSTRLLVNREIRDVSVPSLYFLKLMNSLKRKRKVSQIHRIPATLQGSVQFGCLVSFLLYFTNVMYLVFISASLRKLREKS